MEREQPFHSSPFHGAGEVCGSLPLPKPDFGKHSLNRCLKKTNTRLQSLFPFLRDPIRSLRRALAQAPAGWDNCNKENERFGSFPVNCVPSRAIPEDFQRTRVKSRLPGGNFHGFNEFPGSPHGWLFMGWFHEGLANGYGEMAIRRRAGSLRCSELCGNGMLGSFYPKKQGGEGRNREKVAGLWWHWKRE